jgi:hypothetical protein
MVLTSSFALFCTWTVCRSADAALAVTFTNSLGAIAARGDTTQAERRKAKTDSAVDLADLRPDEELSHTQFLLTMWE